MSSKNRIICMIAGYKGMLMAIGEEYGKEYIRKIIKEGILEGILDD